MVRITKANHIMDLPPVLRSMIFSFCMCEEKVLTTTRTKPPLLQVSKQIRAEAQHAFDQEKELIILVGSNFSDRALKRKYPATRLDAEYVDYVDTTTGLTDIDNSTRIAFRALHFDTLFHHIRFHIYSEAGIRSTQQLSRQLCGSDAAYDIELEQMHRRRESLLVSNLSISHSHRKFRFQSQYGKLHPEVYRPRPTMMKAPRRPYETCDVRAASIAAVLRAQQIAACEDFRGYSISDIEAITSRFRYLTPRGRLQAAILEVIKRQRERT